MGDGTAVSKTGADLLGNRRFESISLQRRVRCEPDFRRLRGRLALGITARRGSGKIESRCGRATERRPVFPYGIKIGEVRCGGGATVLFGTSGVSWSSGLMTCELARTRTRTSLTRRQPSAAERRVEM